MRREHVVASAVAVVAAVGDFASVAAFGVASGRASHHAVQTEIAE